MCCNHVGITTYKQTLYYDNLNVIVSGKDSAEVHSRVKIYCGKYGEEPKVYGSILELNRPVSHSELIDTIKKMVDNPEESEALGNRLLDKMKG